MQQKKAHFPGHKWGVNKSTKSGKGEGNIDIPQVSYNRSSCGVYTPVNSLTCNCITTTAGHPWKYL